MNPRPYQIECVERAYNELTNGSKSTLVVMSTGLGKTICFSSLIDRMLTEQPGKRAMIIAHRDELIDQAQDKYFAMTGYTPAIEKASRKAGCAKVVVSSIQTLNAGKLCECQEWVCKCGNITRDKFCECGIQAPSSRPKECPSCVEGAVRRMQKFDPSDFAILVVDEGHHAPARSYKRFIRYFDDVPRLGVTATADRYDKLALGQVFDSVAYTYGIEAAISDGWLVPIRQEFVHCKNLDFSQLHTIAGDFNQGELDTIMLSEKVLHQVVSPMIEIIGERPTLVFAVSVAHAEIMAEILNRHEKDSAKFVYGKTLPHDRKSRVQEFREGKFQYLVNCGVFLEGFDAPNIAAIAVARPTKSRALYEQMIGRSTRTITPPLGNDPEERRAWIANSLKPDSLILDFVGNSGRHKLINAIDILGGKYSDGAKRLARKEANSKKNLQDLLEECEDEIRKRELERQEREQKEQERRKKIRAKARYSQRRVDPFRTGDRVAPRSKSGTYMLFGKYRGSPIEDINNGYLEWVLHESNAKPWFLNAVKTELDKREAGRVVITTTSNVMANENQKRTLAKYGFQTDITDVEARRIISEKINPSLRR